ncbi:MAG: DUF4401 domain-containing protein [Desulfobacteraceae bacterium]|nr:DUF4401 domain-containing protein [Desulfobacteraceae bacterium]
MNQSAKQPADILYQAGLAKSASSGENIPQSFWYVKMLLGFSGWLAAFLLLCFLAPAFDFFIENKPALLITGGLMICSAFGLLRVSGNDFYQHLALALSLAGQALVIFLIFDSVPDRGVLAWLGVFAFEAILAAVIPDFVHRVFCSFVGAVAFARMLTYLGCPHIAGGVLMLAASFFWLNEFSCLLRIKTIQAIGYGLVLALILFETITLLGYNGGWSPFTSSSPVFQTAPWMGEVLIASAALYVVLHLLNRHKQPMPGAVSISAFLGTLVVCLVSVKVQGLTVGMVILLLGFAGANRVLMGLGIVSLLFYISSYYYLLETTLLAKALTLLVVGLVLLCLRWLMLHMLPAPKEARHV